jgi:hypothetical protein
MRTSGSAAGVGALHDTASPIWVPCGCVAYEVFLAKSLGNAIAAQAFRGSQLHSHWSQLIVVWICRWGFVIDEVLCAPLRRNGLEGSGCLIEVEEKMEVVAGTLVGKVKRTGLEAEVEFDVPDQAAEVVPEVVHDSGSVGGDDDHGDAETVLVATFRGSQNGGRFVVVPASPIVPGDEDGGRVVGVVSPIITSVDLTSTNPLAAPLVQSLPVHFPPLGTQI